MSPIRTFRDGMPAKRDFEAYKDDMYDLYMKQNKTKKQVMQRMQEQHEFVASDAQYEKTFRAWGWQKHKTGTFWRAITFRVLEAQPLCKDQTLEVFHRGERIENETLEREINRQKTRRSLANLGGWPELPEGVTILIKTDKTLIVCAKLPFHCFEDQLRDSEFVHLLGQSAQTDRFIRLDADTSFRISVNESPLTGYHDLLSDNVAQIHDMGINLTSLTSGIAKPILDAWRAIESPAMNVDIQPCIPLLPRLILSSLANNLAGVSHNFVKRISFYRFVKMTMGKFLSRILYSRSNNHVVRAIAHSLLGLSLVIPDVRLIKWILRREGLCDINAPFQASGKSCTMIQHAVDARHIKLVRLCLSKNADSHDINLKEAQGLPYNIPMPLDETFGLKLTKSLIGAERKISAKLFSALIVNGCSSAVEKCIDEDAVVFANDDFDPTILYHAISSLREDVCVKLLQNLEPLGLDLNVRFHISVREYIFGSYDAIDGPQTLLDLAAVLGSVRLVEYLLCEGVRITVNSFGHAVLGGDQKVLSLLVQEGAAPSNDSCMLSRWFPKYLDHSSNKLHVSMSEPETNTKFGLEDCQSDSTLKYNSTYKRRTKGMKAEETIVRTGTTSYILSRSSEKTESTVMTPLLEALEQHNASEVEFLLDTYATLENPVSSEPQLPQTESLAMLLAVKWGNYRIIELLCRAGAQLNIFESSDPDRVTPLGFAIVKSDVTLARILLHAGADVNYNSFCWSDELYTKDSKTGYALAVAILHANVPMIHLLLSYGASFHLRDLLEGSRRERSQRERSERERAQGKRARSSLRKYTSGKDEPGFQLRVRIKHHIICAAMPSHPGYEALQIIWDSLKSHDLMAYYAAVMGILCFYISQDDSIDRFAKFAERLRDLRGFPENSKLYKYAMDRAKDGQLRYLEVLLGHGYNPQYIASRWIRFGTAETAFLRGITSGNLKTVELFLRYKAEINFEPKLGVRRSPLQLAAECGHTEIVQLLLRHGANINASASHRAGGTALQLAAIGGHNRIVVLLIEYGADVNAPPSKVDGRTALQGAAEHGRLDTVKVLMNAGAANEGKDRAEIQRAIDFAVKEGFTYIGDLLDEYLVSGQSTAQSHFGDAWEDYHAMSDMMNPYDPAATAID